MSDMGPKGVCQRSKRYAVVLLSGFLWVFVCGLRWDGVSAPKTTIVLYQVYIMSISPLHCAIDRCIESVFN